MWEAIDTVFATAWNNGMGRDMGFGHLTYTDAKSILASPLGLQGLLLYRQSPHARPAPAPAAPAPAPAAPFFADEPVSQPVDGIPNLCCVG